MQKKLKYIKYILYHNLPFTRQQWHAGQRLQTPAVLKRTQKPTDWSEEPINQTSRTSPKTIKQLESEKCFLFFTQPKVPQETNEESYSLYAENITNRLW